VYLYDIVAMMRNVSDKICRANRNTHFMFNKVLLGGGGGPGPGGGGGGGGKM
jgi:hypothetical protein